MYDQALILILIIGNVLYKESTCKRQRESSTFESIETMGLKFTFGMQFSSRFKNTQKLLYFIQNEYLYFKHNRIYT